MKKAILRRLAAAFALAAAMLCFAAAVEPPMDSHAEDSAKSAAPVERGNPTTASDGFAAARGSAAAVSEPAEKSADFQTPQTGVEGRRQNDFTERLPAAASSQGYDPELFQRQMEAVGGGSLTDSLTPEQRGYLSGVSASPDASPWDSFLRLFRNARADAGGALRDTLRSLLKIFLIAVLCGCANGFAQEHRQVVTMGGALAVAVVLFQDFRSVLHAVLAAIEQVGVLAAGMFPVMAAALTLTGAAGTAAATQTAGMFAFDLVIRMIEKLLVPAVCAYLAVLTVNAAAGGDLLASLGGLIRWAVTGVLKLVLTLFITFLTLGSSVSGSVDQFSLKAARFAVSGSVPVVGGIISDAAESMLSGAVLVKNAVGVLGMLCVAAVCVVPFLKAGAAYLAFKAGAAVMSPVCGKELGSMLSGIGEGIGLLLGMLGACCAILFFEMVLAIVLVKG